MEPIKLRAAHGPEWICQNKHFVPFLRNRGWLVEVTQGNMYQTGLPDLFIGHPTMGQRWVDLKIKGHYQFTKAQQHKWPKWDAHGVGIWIVAFAGPDDCTHERMEEEYEKIVAKEPNWKDYWKDSYGPIDIHLLLDEIYGEYDGDSEKS